MGPNANSKLKLAQSQTRFRVYPGTWLSHAPLLGRVTLCSHNKPIELGALWGWELLIRAVPLMPGTTPYMPCILPEVYGSLVKDLKAVVTWLYERLERSASALCCFAKADVSATMSCRCVSSACTPMYCPVSRGTGI